MTKLRNLVVLRVTIKGNNCASREKFRLTVTHLMHVLVFGGFSTYGKVHRPISLMHVIDKLSCLRRTDDFSSANGKNSIAKQRRGGDRWKKMREKPRWKRANDRSSYFRERKEPDRDRRFET